MDEALYSTEMFLNESLANGSILDNDTMDFDCIIRQEENGVFYFIMYGVLLNAVGVMGIIGNVISITILSRPNMRSSINCCLVGLASFDTILLLTSLLMFGISAIPEYTGTLMWYHTDVFPYIVQAAYPLGVIAQTGSVYLTLTVTLERYVAVCHPLRARSICTYGRAKLYVIVVALFALLYNIPRFWEVTYKTCDIENVTFTAVVMTDMRKNDVYIEVYINWLYLIVMYLLPFIGLLVFNVFIYKQVLLVRKFALRQGSEKGVEVRLANHELQRLSRLQRKELSLAVMLLCVVCVFFLCNILALIVNVLEMLGIVNSTLTMLSNFLVTVNSSVNFIIYCIFGQKFRRLFLQLFCFGAFRRFTARDGPLLESGIGGNSVYGEPKHRTDGRSTFTRSVRMSSWSNTQSNRITQNNGTWHSGRGLMPMITNNTYSTIPVTESGKNGSGHIKLTPACVETPMLSSEIDGCPYDKDKDELY